MQITSASGLLHDVWHLLNVVTLLIYRSCQMTKSIHHLLKWLVVPSLQDSQPDQLCSWPSCAFLENELLVTGHSPSMLKAWNVSNPSQVR